MAAATNARPRTRAHWLAFLVVPVAAVLVLLAGVAGLMPPSVARPSGSAARRLWAAAI